MDGDTGPSDINAADANEGLVGDALRRLVFGRPSVQSRLVRATTRGDGPAIASLDQNYVEITLATQSLASNRVLTSRFRPVFYAQGAFAQDLHRPIQMAALVADPQDVGGEHTSSAPGKVTSEGVAAGDRRLFTQTPWRGRLEAQFSLLACRSEAILKALLPLSDDIRKSIGGSADTASGAAGAVLRSLAPGALAMDVASATARAFIRMDGQWTARCEHTGAVPDLSPGHYVLLALKREGEQPPSLEYDPVQRLLFADGRKVERRDYAVLRVEASKRRESIADLPELGAAFEAIDLVYAAGGDTAPVVEKFRRLAMTSPFLTDSDRKDLIQRVVRRTETLKAAIEEPSERNESLLASMTRAGGVPDLKTLWKTDAGAIGRLRAQPSASAPATSATATPTEATASGEDGKPPPATLNAATPLPAATNTDLARDPLSRFQTIMTFTLDWERGVSLDPASGGQPTKDGVPETIFHAWLEDQGMPVRPVARMEPAERDVIYRTNYWLGARCSDLPATVDFCQFDAAVNHGPGGAARLLQRAINRALRDIGSDAELRNDGAIGPKTLNEARRIDAKRLYQCYLIERRALYQRIVDKDPARQLHLKGWLNRVAALELFIEASSGERGASTMGPIAPEDSPFAGFVQ